MWTYCPSQRGEAEGNSSWRRFSHSSRCLKVAREALNQKWVTSTISPPPHCTGQTHEQWHKNYAKRVSLCPKGTIYKIVRPPVPTMQVWGRPNKTKLTKQKYFKELLIRGVEAAQRTETKTVLSTCVKVLSTCTRPGSWAAASGRLRECRLKPVKRENWVVGRCGAGRDEQEEIIGVTQIEMPRMEKESTRLSLTPTESGRVNGDAALTVPINETLYSVFVLETRHDTGSWRPRIMRKRTGDASRTMRRI